MVPKAGMVDILTELKAAGEEDNSFTIHSNCITPVGLPSIRTAQRESRVSQTLSASTSSDQICLRPNMASGCITTRWGPIRCSGHIFEINNCATGLSSAFYLNYIKRGDEEGVTTSSWGWQCHFWRQKHPNNHGFEWIMTSRVVAAVDPAVSTSRKNPQDSLGSSCIYL